MRTFKWNNLFSRPFGLGACPGLRRHPALKPGQRPGPRRGPVVAAFTIIELLVAVAVASILLFLVNLIFNDTQQAMSKGIALSDIIANTRGASQQFELDAKQMIGPGEDTDPKETDPLKEGGFLVITQHAISASVRRGPRGYEAARPSVTGDRYFGTDKQMGPVRSDQLWFIRKREDGADGMLPITPEFNGTFGNDFAYGTPRKRLKSDYVKVWYGHALKTAENGSVPAFGASNGGLGESGPNQIANDWILGRQAMFLVDEGTSSDNKPDFPSAYIYADAAQFNAQVNGYGAASLPTGNVNKRVYAGLTDMTAQRLGSATSSNQDGRPSIINDLSNGTYAAKALKYGFVKETGSGPAKRLHANPKPRFDAGDDNYAYAAWQVAQMHPVFMAHVSDFIVEFAADADLDGEVDTVSNVDIDGDGNKETGPFIKWYTHVQYANNPTSSAPSPTYDPDKPLTYTPPATYTPYLTGTAASVGTSLPALDSAPHASAAFVWRHDDENSNRTANPNQPSFWPYLIRIRYRMHDSRGIIESGDNQHGIWFEHVIRVNRPVADDSP